MKVLNLGWGVQSWTLAAMVALGELEPIDVAIHADTTHERESTYKFATKWTPWLEARGVRVVTVNPEKTMPINNGYGWPEIPAFATSEKGGSIQRQCTSRWKIAPIKRWLQANRNGEPVEQWLGITTDEAERMKPSDVKYVTNRWPLIEKRMSRNACIAWLTRHGLDIPDKSACVFCPFHNRSAWWSMKSEGGADWQKAIAVDEAIRKARPPFDLFVHSSRVPLADIKSPQDNGQIDMFEQNECEGICFV